jgi:hypothetical protein
MVIMSISRTEVMRKPNLFIVGAPKCGTTAMHAYLAAHPDIFMTADKEPRFFATDLIAKAKARGREVCQYASMDDYMRLYDGWKNERFAGESTVWYLISKNAAQEIHDLNPDARIIIMVREPVDLLLSLHSMWYNLGIEDQKDFVTALKNEKARADGAILPPRAVEKHVFTYHDVIRFSDNLKKFQRLFPAKNIKVIVYDDLRRDTKATYLDLINWLGVDPSFVPSFDVVNKYSAYRSRFLHRIRTNDRLGHLMLRILPARVLAFLRGTYRRINASRDRRTPLAIEDRRALMARYKQEVMALSKMIGRDLVTEWGYQDIG